MIKRIIFSGLLVLFSVAMANAQCPMCKAAAESSLESGSTMALGLNAGILYLLIMPYAFISILFFIWYYNNKEKVVKA
ncbi:MAG: hypothetical protein WD048_09415 [Chitinophagales bacterium]